MLGPLELRTADNVIPVRAPGRRSLLAALLLAPNQEVSVSRLVDVIWGHSPPSSAVANLRSQIAALRRILSSVDGAAARLETRPGGYRIVVRPGELDLTVFKDLVRLARHAVRESRHPEALELFGRALALWRGEPLANVALLGGAEADLARLGETRLAVLEEYLRTRLTCGEHADVVSELQGLVVEHPLRESLWSLLVHALHHAGRRAEALVVYGRARTHLAEELGLDPGPDLRDAHARLLAGDPASR